MDTRQVEVVRYRENWVVSTRKCMNSTTNDDRKGQHERWAEIDSNIANGLQAIAMLRRETSRRSPTKR